MQSSQYLPSHRVQRNSTGSRPHERQPFLLPNSFLSQDMWSAAELLHRRCHGVNNFLVYTSASRFSNRENDSVHRQPTPRLTLDLSNRRVYVSDSTMKLNCMELSNNFHRNVVSFEMFTKAFGELSACQAGGPAIYLDFPGLVLFYNTLDCFLETLES